MIAIRHSNRLEALVEALGDALPSSRAADVAPTSDAAGDGAGDDAGAPDRFDHLFDGPWLVIPSRPLRLYVDLAIARRHDIAGHHATMTLWAAFTRLCAEALPDLVLVERGHIVGELLAVLQDPAHDGAAAWPPIHAHLFAAGREPAAVDRRRVEVAQSLGALFDAWTQDRPELVEAWRAGANGGARGRGVDPLERAERNLWTALFGPGGRFERRGAAEGRRYLTLDAVFAERLDEAWRPPSEIHVVGLPALSPGLGRALERLGARTTLTLYALDPCREFWEDLDTRRRPGANAARAADTRPAPAPRARRTKPRASSDGRQLELAGAFSSVQPAATAPATTAAATATDAPSDTTTAATDGDPDRDGPLLASWGQLRRETIRLLGQLGDGVFEDRFVDPRSDASDGAATTTTTTTAATTTTTLLRQIQLDLLDRAPLRQGARRLSLAPDGSVEIWGAPDPRRELEAIAAEIWALMRAANARPLRFSDCAVAFAGPEQPYLALVRAVFREAAELPHAVVDEPLAMTSQMVEAVSALLALPDGALSRREVLDVLVHPNVRARFPDASAQVWMELCDALAIAHGADRDALADTYVDRDVFNWDQGLKRLALGQFARGPRSGVEEPIRLGGGSDAGGSSDADRADGATGPEAYVPAELAADLRPDANALGLLVRSLLADARFARTARLPLPEWMRFVRALMNAYLVAVTPADDAARLRILTVLDRLGAQSPPDVPVALGVARALLSDALADLRGSRGQLLGDGVTVGTLASLRALPFRVVFVAGLGAGRFPAADRVSPLELDGHRGAPHGGSASRRDRDLFLDAWLGARDKLVLSYVDRDPLTGERQDPSAVVIELRDALQQGYLAAQPGEPAAAITRTLRLHRDEDAAVRAAFPAAAAEAEARAVGQRLADTLPELARLDEGELRRALSPESRRHLAPLLRTIEPPRVAAEPEAESGSEPASPRGPARGRRVLRLADLRRFLECPLQGSARVFLGLRELDDDTELRETTDEPFDLPRRLERALLGEVFVSAWRATPALGDDALGAAYDAATARHGVGRALPAGLFREHVRRRHLDVLRQWAGAVGQALPALHAPARRICFGRPAPFAPDAELRPPLVITVDGGARGPIELELHGTTEPIVDTGAGARASVVLASSPGADKERNDKDSLRAFFDHVALAAAAPDDDPPLALTAFVCRPSRDGSEASVSRRAFVPLDARRARAYLADVAGELLSRVHDYLFPCEAVFLAQKGELTLFERIHQIRTDRFYRDHSSSRFGPVPEPFEYPVPPEEDVERMRARRFGLFLTPVEAAPTDAPAGVSGTNGAKGANGAKATAASAARPRRRA